MELAVGFGVGLFVGIPLVVFIITLIYDSYFPAKYHQTRYVYRNPNQISIGANHLLYVKQNSEIPYGDANFTKGLYKVPSGLSVVLPENVNTSARGSFTKAVIRGSRRKNGVPRRSRTGRR